MDSVTQAVLGAAVGVAVLSPGVDRRKAAVLGAIAGTIPDLDVVLLPFFDGLQRVSIHRGFSHSILFSILGALLLAWILSRIKWTAPVAGKRLWLFAFLVLFTHIALDAFTPYGTQLFLPFSDHRVSFDSVTVVDPMYTLPLLACLLMGLFVYKSEKHRAAVNYLGLGISTLYLLMTLVHKQQIEKHFKAALADQGVQYEKLLSVPVSAANLIWYGVAKNDKGLYLGKHSVWDDGKIDFDYFPTNDTLLAGLDPYLVDRMKWFAKGFYTVTEHEGKIRLYNLQCDMQGIRFSGNTKAPTAFYFEITPLGDTNYLLSSGMHPKNSK